MKPDKIRPIKSRDWLHGIAREVSNETGVSVRKIFGYCRRSEFVRARHEVIRRANGCGISREEIARTMGLDVSTVRYAIEKTSPPMFRSVRAGQ